MTTIEDKPARRTGPKTLQVRVAPLNRVVSPNDPLKTCGWYLENLGLGDVAVLGNPPGLELRLFCELSPGDAAAFEAAGIALQSLDQLGATIFVALY
jgi:hypothetical protein